MVNNKAIFNLSNKQKGINFLKFKAIFQNFKAINQLFIYLFIYLFSQCFHNWVVMGLEGRLAS